MIYNKVLYRKETIGSFRDSELDGTQSNSTILVANSSNEISSKDFTLPYSYSSKYLSSCQSCKKFLKTNIVSFFTESNSVGVNSHAVVIFTL